MAPAVASGAYWGILNAFSVKATFFCCGRALERNPKLGPRLVESGHEVACHGWRYVPYYHISEAEQREEIRKDVDVIRTICGVDPVGWVSRVPDLSTRRLLVEHGGFLYDCDGYDDDLPYGIDVHGHRLIAVAQHLRQLGREVLAAAQQLRIHQPREHVQLAEGWSRALVGGGGTLPAHPSGLAASPDIGKTVESKPALAFPRICHLGAGRDVPDALRDRGNLVRGRPGERGSCTPGFRGLWGKPTEGPLADRCPRRHFACCELRGGGGALADLR